MINFRNLVKSFKYAIKGLSYVFRHEQNFRIQAVLGVTIILLTLFLKIPVTQAAILILVVIMVLVLELFNTVTERLIDVLRPRLHHYVEVIKDLTAAAVFIASLGAIVIGLLIIGPYILRIWLTY